jgi:hypothetical protein
MNLPPIACSTTNHQICHTDLGYIQTFSPSAGKSQKISIFSPIFALILILDHAGPLTALASTRGRGRPLHCTRCQAGSGSGRLLGVAHRNLADVDDLYTALADNRQPAPAGCRGVVHRELAGVDDLHTARAANRQPAPAGCGGLGHRKLACVDDLYSRPQPAVGWWCTGKSRALTTSTLHGPPTGSRLRQAVGVLHRKIADVDDLYLARAANLQPAPAGCGGAGKSRAWTASTQHGLPTGSRPLPAVGCVCTGKSRT